jgi:hypothetical protein
VAAVGAASAAADVIASTATAAPVERSERASLRNEITWGTLGEETPASERGSRARLAAALS